MSEKYLNRDERMKEIRRYLDGDMTDSERNSFERKLQGDPFDEDALEGLGNLSADDLEKDLNSLNRRLKKRPNRQTPIYYRIAAALVVLMAISSLFLVRELKKPSMMVSDNISVKEDSVFDYKAPGSPVETPDETMQEDKITTMRKEAKPSQSVGEEAELNQEENTLMLDQVLGEKAVAIDTAIRTDPVKIAQSAPEIEEEQVVEGGAETIIAAEERNITAGKSAKKLMEPVAPVSAREEAAAEVEDAGKGEIARLDEDTEVVMTEAVRGEDIVGNRRPVPMGGMKDFKEYIDTDQIFPAEWTESNRETVRLEITVGQEGEIKKIEVLKTPSKDFSDEAVRLVKEGPPWLPATRDSVRIEESIKIRIVFSR